MNRHTLADRGLVQVGFQAYRIHNDMIKEATERERERLGLPKLSTASYMRRKLLPLIAAELGVECPEFLSLDGPNDLIAQAAAKRGISVKDFQALAAKEFAARELGLQQPSQPPPAMKSTPPAGAPLPQFRAPKAPALPAAATVIRRPGKR